MKRNKISPEHPRAESIRIRGKLIEECEKGIVAQAGLLAHGRGEAFDYLIGERTTSNAHKAIKAAASLLLAAKKPVVSVNGNAAALAAKDIVRLAQITEAEIEVNLFHRSIKREENIKKLLEKSGAKEVLGVGEAASARIPEIASDRRRVDPNGILKADVVLVPLEDGDRTEALMKMGKKVIAIDLNPLSRTSQFASITIVDNIVRAMPALVRTAKQLKKENKKKLKELTKGFDNRKNLCEATGLINQRLLGLAQKGVYVTITEKSRS